MTTNTRDTRQKPMMENMPEQISVSSFGWVSHLADQYEVKYVRKDGDLVTRMRDTLAKCRPYIAHCKPLPCDNRQDIYAEIDAILTHFKEGECP